MCNAMLVLEEQILEMTLESWTMGSMLSLAHLGEYLVWNLSYHIHSRSCFRFIISYNVNASHFPFSALRINLVYTHVIKPYRYDPKEKFENKSH